MDKTMSSNLPLVSILVAAYNQEAYIARTLDSLLGQDCPFDYEILVGEDCSTDATRDICREYANQHPEKIRLFLNADNKGLIRNYFDLLLNARGTYLADCGGDDYWIRKDKLRRQVELLEAHPDVLMVGSNWQWLNQQTGVIIPNQLKLEADRFEPQRYGKQAVTDYLNRNDYPHMVLSTACFRTAAVKNLLETVPERFTGNTVVCEDLPITLSLLMQGPIYLMKEDTLVYRVLERSMSHEQSTYELQKGFTNKAFWQTLELAGALGISPKELKPYLNRQLPDLFYTGLMTNDSRWLNEQWQRLRKQGISLTLKQRLMMLLLHSPWKPWNSRKPSSTGKPSNTGDFPNHRIRKHD